MRHPDATSAMFDVAVIGGGINGAGIACEAASRGLSAALMESHDFAIGTSSRSSKLIHGGLRYLEYYDFRLVREALGEREALMRIAPHLIWPIRFVMPVTPGGKPAWMLRAGLFLYDHLASRRVLPASERVDLHSRRDGMGFRKEFRRAFIYSDCRVDDARLVIANVLGAERHGATIMPRTRFETAERDGRLWRVRVTSVDSGQTTELRARTIVNAAGPWAVATARSVGAIGDDVKANLVRGSHIVLPKLYEGAHATMLQVGDGRIVVTMPYEDGYTLVGTTDNRFEGDPRQVEITSGERNYLLDVVRRFFRSEVEAGDIVWSYSGVRPLFEEGKTRDGDPTTATRDYAFKIDRGPDRKGAPILTVLGGKLTTYRRLAQHAVGELSPLLGVASAPASSRAIVLPGGEIGEGGTAGHAKRLLAERPFLAPGLASRLARTYGSRADDLLGDARRESDLGASFGGDLHEREVDFLTRTEWAASADDILWRRTKCGLRVTRQQADGLADFLAGAPVSRFEARQP